MRSRSITALVAAPHSYKSFLMLAMAIALDFDLPLFGRFKPVRSMRTFFIGSDAPDWDYGQVTHKLWAGYGIKPERRHLQTVHGVFDEKVDALDPEFLKWLFKYDNVEGFDVIMFDSKRSIARINENDSQDAARLNGLFRHLRSRGKTVIYAHHTSIAANTDGRPAIYAGRGSSDDGAACDFQFNLQNVDNIAVGNKKIRIIPAKGRGLVAPPDLDILEAIFTPSGEVNAAGEPIDAVRFMGASRLGRREIILRELGLGMRDRGSLTQALMSQDANYTEEGAYKAVDNELQMLKRKGKVTNMDGMWALVQENV